MKDYIICCDWGTSSLRLRLIDKEQLAVIDEEIADKGIGQVYEQWKAEEANGDLNNRIHFFLSSLQVHLNRLQERNPGLEGIPVIISGMASSSLGILELPYAELPFALSGKDMVIHKIKASPRFDHQVVILSGVKGDHEVMRGEETQLVGIAHSVPALDDAGQAIVLLPGTHSKHVHIQGGYIQKIETYITGELFALLTKNGLLKESVQPSHGFSDGDDWVKAFTEGIEYSGSTSLLKGLFKIRTNQLFNRLDKWENYNYLSGLLIGNELRNLLNIRDTRIFLCSAHNLYAQYKLALEQLGLKDITCFVDPDMVEQGTVKGQIMIARERLTIV